MRWQAVVRKAADGQEIRKAQGACEAVRENPEIEAVCKLPPDHLHVPLTLQAIAAGERVREAHRNRSIKGGAAVRPK